MLVAHQRSTHNLRDIPSLLHVFPDENCVSLFGHMPHIYYLLLNKVIKGINKIWPNSRLVCSMWIMPDCPICILLNYSTVTNIVCFKKWAPNTESALIGYSTHSEEVHIIALHVFWCHAAKAHDKTIQAFVKHCPSIRPSCSSYINPRIVYSTWGEITSATV